MDLLRAHADAVLIGAGTLILEKHLARPRPRGPVFRIVEPTLQQLRAKLRKGVEKNVFVTATGNLQFSEFAVFDGDRVESAVLTSPDGAEKLAKQSATYPHVRIIGAGQGSILDLSAALRALRSELGVQHLLCEGGPRLYGNLLRAGLIDEKFVTVAPFDAGQIIPAEQETVTWEQPAIRPTIFSGEGLTKERMVHWSWVSGRKIGDYQFNRYRKVL